MERAIHLVLRDSDTEHSELMAERPELSLSDPAALSPIPEDASREAVAESASQDQLDATRNVTVPLVESTPPANAARRVLLRSHSERERTTAYAPASVPTRAERRARRQSDTLFTTLIWSLAVVELWSHPLLLVACLPLLALLLATSLQGCCPPQLQSLAARIRAWLAARVSRTAQSLQRSAHAHQYLPGPLLSLGWLYTQADRLVSVHFSFASLVQLFLILYM